jgi:integrase
VKAQLGKQTINRLKPAEKPYEVRDTRLAGFLLRVQPSGKMTYYAEYGRGRRLRIGATDAVGPEKARQRAKDIIGEAMAGGDPAAGKREAKSHTFETFVREVYQPWAEANLKTGSTVSRRLLSAFADLRKKKLSEITPWLVEKWRSQRLKAGTKPATVNRDLASLNSALQKAVDWGHLEAHPVRSVKRTRTDQQAAPRYLTREEERRLRDTLKARDERIQRERESANAWRHARGYPLLPEINGDHLTPMVLLALLTGLRRGELFNLRWEDVDFAGASLAVRGGGAKSGQTRHVPLNSEAVDVLRRWQAQTGGAAGLAFPGRNGGRLDNIRSAWESVIAEAKIEDFRFHDLRHTFASRLVMAGVDLNTVRELLGHSDYKMTLRYAHLAPEHKAAAVAKLMEVN